ncbi:Glucan endo-1,3-beta-glucosidase A1 precursor [Gemmata obscuriglobus]|uniref:Glycoside hydrolase family 16 protein n=1 Tax=Gemmata obscuriglobus TaxID=114 RepID=A0A2Z3GX21_9BACT|nr:glycoside hydrolase family 16 protein [Gemmata obscuriglobus]AWM39019.1 glycoside hydrolase family 16 protein [Gemmata obscuriglobus]QEG27949.1 Glucan endo-1,3-beta-glucosidase A1 precursor [Gemmata obscuriglobus]VTS05424.1 glucan endo- -beta-d-glucosidase : Glycoside hydrolase family 16 OS=Planctomyces limnophilus (strain ATCC 43296 / DSM 3776 / IFAM 1008 / 290) GN=Plim_1398 PE=4 SV=1: Glyco_hydro_16 [Gemmata obscuriglobus UQM 2246]
MHAVRFAGPIACAAAVAAAVSAFAPKAADADKAPVGWKLVWSDEFDGKEIDRTKWDFDLGNGFYNYDANQWISGWGNNELQYYTREPENAFVKDGALHIVAIKESYQGCGYTSARLKTRKRDGRSLFSKKYGRFEFRAKLPPGQGVWPALWMLPQSDKYGTWASSGEIDVMEAKGQEPTKVLGTLHYGSRWPNNAHASKTYTFPDQGTITDYHVYAVEWTPGEVRWSVDDTVAGTHSFWWSSSKLDGEKGARPKQEADLNPWPAPFDQEFYLVMNVAVGGNFLGKPDRTTKFPAEMLVDYVRVYDRVGGYGAAKPRGAGQLPFGK